MALDFHYKQSGAKHQLLDDQGRLVEAVNSDVLLLGWSDDL